MTWKFRKRSEKPLTRTVYASQGPEFILSDLSVVHKFCSNKIISSRYTWLNFVPKNVFEQFHNIANIFFGLITVLYMFADSATSIWANLGPLLAIIIITMLKDGIDDIFRHRSDRKLNNTLYRVLRFDTIERTISWMTTTAGALKVGDVCLCEKNQSFPCDMVVLTSSNPSTELNVTTANLDGETNIKRYYAVTDTQPFYLRHPPNEPDQHLPPSEFTAETERLFARVECQTPNADLTKFEGRISTDSTQDAPLSFHNVVLRGAKLKNTAFIMGLVIYTGRETKLSLNGMQSKRKYSSRESKSNVILLAFILVMFILAIIFSVLYLFFNEDSNITVWYFDRVELNPWRFVQTVFRFIFFLNYLIPISIILTIDFQQLLIAYLISSDLKMYNEDEDLSAKANTAQLADELGQVEFLFSDKTGTLTQNVMSLCFCTVLNLDRVYTFQQNTDLSVSDPDTESLTMDPFDTASWSSPSPSADSSSSSDSEDEFTNVQANRESDQLYHKPDNEETFRQFLLMTALCHTVDVNRRHGHKVEGDFERSDFHYEASSPDEKALVEASADQGLVFTGSQPIEGENGKCYTITKAYPSDDSSRLRVETEKYMVDAVLPFTSVRKRMTILVRYPNGTYHVHSKGADSVMLEPERCPPSSGTIRNRAVKNVTDFAVRGYRTLVFSSREVSEQEYEDLLTGYSSAMGRIGEEHENHMERAFAAIEKELMPFYVTAVEDVLQSGVKTCLRELHEAGIQVWVLTGDKVETAITVSQSAGHFTQQMSLLRLTECPNLETAACWVFEQLEGLQVRMEHRSHKHNPVPNTREQLQPTEEEIEGVLYAVAEQQYNNREEEVADSAVERGSVAGARKRLLTFLGRGKSVNHRIHRRRHRRRPGLGGEPVGLVVDGETLSYLIHVSTSKFMCDTGHVMYTILQARYQRVSHKAKDTKSIMMNGTIQVTFTSPHTIDSSLKPSGGDHVIVLTSKET